ELYALCQKAFLCIVILRVDIWSRCTRKTSKKRPPPRLNAGRVKKKAKRDFRQSSPLPCLGSPPGQKSCQASRYADLCWVAWSPRSNSDLCFAASNDRPELTEVRQGIVGFGFFRSQNDSKRHACNDGMRKPRC